MSSNEAEPAARQAPLRSLSSSSSFQIRAPISFSSSSGSEIDLDSDAGSGSGSESEPESATDEAVPVPAAGPTPHPTLDRLGSMPVARLTNDDETEEEEVFDDVDGDGFVIRVAVPVLDSTHSSSEDEDFDEVDGDGFSTTARVSSQGVSSFATSPNPSLAVDDGDEAKLSEAHELESPKWVPDVVFGGNEGFESEADGGGDNGDRGDEFNEKDWILSEETSSTVEESDDLKSMEVESVGIDIENGVANEVLQKRREAERNAVQAPEIGDQNPNLEESLDVARVLGNSSNVVEYSESSEEEAFDEVDGDGFRVSSQDGSSNVSPRPSLVAKGVLGESEGNSVADGIVGSPYLTVDAVHVPNADENDGGDVLLGKDLNPESPFEDVILSEDLSPNVVEYSEGSEEEAFDEVDGDGFRVSSQDGSTKASPRPSLVSDGVLGDSERSYIADWILGGPNLNEAIDSKAGSSGDNGDSDYEPNETVKILGVGFEARSSIIEDSGGLEVGSDKIESEKVESDEAFIQGQVEYITVQAVDAVLVPNADENDGEDGLLGKDLHPESHIKDVILSKDHSPSVAEYSEGSEEEAFDEVNDAGFRVSSQDGSTKASHRTSLVAYGVLGESERSFVADGVLGRSAYLNDSNESDAGSRGDNGDRDYEPNEETSLIVEDSEGSKPMEVESDKTKMEKGGSDKDFIQGQVENREVQAVDAVLDPNAEENDGEDGLLSEDGMLSEDLRIDEAVGNNVSDSMDGTDEGNGEDIDDVDEKDEMLAIGLVQTNTIDEVKSLIVEREMYDINEYSKHKAMESRADGSNIFDSFPGDSHQNNKLDYEDAPVVEFGISPISTSNLDEGNDGEASKAVSRVSGSLVASDIGENSAVNLDALYEDQTSPVDDGKAANKIDQHSISEAKPSKSDSTRIPPANSLNISVTSNLAVASKTEKAITEKEEKFLEQVELIRVKFLRIIHRLGCSPSDNIAASVLYHLAGIKDTNHGMPNLEGARNKALKLEVEEKEELDFSCNILIIGKSGVGKSATINSIFEEEKSLTNAFEPETTSVRKIEGFVDGIKIRVLDTPGLKTSLLDQASNRRVLSSVKKHTKKCLPDVVLYMDRLNTHACDFNDLPLLRSITSTLGSSIWSSAVLVLSHAATEPPEGPSGLPLSYESFVDQRSVAVQQSIRQAAGDTALMNPVVLVENHPSCRRNREGQRVLPNGSRWRSELLLLCCSSKILSESNSLSEVRESSVQKLFKARLGRSWLLIAGIITLVIMGSASERTRRISPPISTPRSRPSTGALLVARKP